MMKKEGTYICVLEFPNIWPPLKPSTIIETVHQNEKLLLSCNENGGLLFDYAGLQFKSQPVRFSKANRAIITILWNDSSDDLVKIDLNNTTLKSDATAETAIIESKYPLDKDESPPTSEMIMKACSKWILWRKLNLGKTKEKPRSERKLKSTSEQIAELKTAIDSLAHHIVHFRDDPKLLAVNTFPLLRSLLFWPDSKNSNYNPLLFRLASKIDFPLPVFALKDRIESSAEHPVLSKAAKSRTNNFPTLQKKSKNEELMDFQEWLNIGFFRSSTSPIKRWKDLIFDGANTVSAHFDEDKYDYIDDLTLSIMWDITEISFYLTVMSEVTIYYGQKIIKTTANNGS